MEKKNGYNIFDRFTESIHVRNIGLEKWEKRRRWEWQKGSHERDQIGYGVVQGINSLE
jgi:hypothetical protein